ncbi:Arylsulfatase A [Halogranum amylolyticum]|uniref:Arylsulfatase A n=1 Tax=Halogranum amylolyticum TaxID=660520 RepID=A0A1H8STW2_9EURY|nr:sulfatase [Halogranum amylolyticum]SEO82200.1 Arylsulfatase A [Halogranum amylolyticum]
MSRNDSRRQTRPNVLLVVLDSVRAGNTSLHGHANETTPFLDEFATSATRYDQARSPGSWSLPSHTSVFTGLHVAEHGVTEPTHRLAAGNTIFEELRSDGYETAVFSENPWLTVMDVGLDAGFETVSGAQNVLFPEAANPTEFTAAEGQGQYVAYLKRCLDDDHPIKSLLNGVGTKLAWDHPELVPDWLVASAPASAYVDRFVDWHGDREGSWAACINLMDGHAPYEPAPEHDLWGGERLRKLQADLGKHVWSFHGGDAPWWQCRAFEALYDGAIHQMDAQLRRIVETLKQRDELDDTLLVVTSDHGEAFGELSRLKGTKLVGHVEGVHESQLHVPLVVKRPGQETGERVSAPASLTNFPAVVRAVLDGDDERAESGFAEGPVVASSAGLTEPNTKLAREYCDADDLWQFRGEMRAVFEDDANDDVDGAVLKYADWADEAVDVRVVEAHASYVRGRDDSGRVERVFDGFSDAGVRETGTDVDDVDDATRQRLRDLGYAE